MTYRVPSTPRTEGQDKNLRELIELLEEFHEKEIELHDQGSFVRVSARDEFNPKPVEAGQIKGQFVGLQLIELEEKGDNVCGTTACAAGWTLIQKGFGFRDVGTVFKDPYDDTQMLYWRTHVKFPGDDTWYEDGKIPVEKSEDQFGVGMGSFLNFEAIAAGYLGLTEYEAEEIFFTMGEAHALQKLKAVLDGTFEPYDEEEPEDEYGE